MTYVGFKRATIKIGSEAPVANSNLFVIEGTDGEGATMEANITGLAKEPSKVYGSNIAYYTSRKGVGDVSADMTLLDIPDAVQDKILGYTHGTAESSLASATFIGEDTEAPYASVLLESETMNGDNTVLLGLLKGSFSKNEAKLTSLNGDTFTPEGEAFVFTAIASDTEGDAKGQYVVKYIGNDATTISAIKQLMGIEATV
jgi:phi13 family phage major tail protein